MSGHLQRTFACFLLLRNCGHFRQVKRMDEAEFFLQTSAATLLRLTESSVALDRECQEHTLCFLIWLYDAQLHSAFRPFTTLCTVLLAIHLGTPAEFHRQSLSNWVYEEETSCRSRLDPRDINPDRWLFGLNSYERPDRRRKWREFAVPILERGGLEALTTHLTNAA